MIPAYAAPQNRPAPSPRTRGDDPKVIEAYRDIGVFSPHPRG